MTTTYTAQVSPRRGRWCLYVVLLGVDVGQWPEYDFAPGAVVPTVQERSRALNALGYVFTDGAEWQWEELSENPQDPASAVRLFASVSVEEAG